MSPRFGATCWLSFGVLLLVAPSEGRIGLGKGETSFLRSSSPPYLSPWAEATPGSLLSSPPEFSGARSRRPAGGLRRGKLCSRALCEDRALKLGAWALGDLQEPSPLRQKSSGRSLVTLSGVVA